MKFKKGDNIAVLDDVIKGQVVAVKGAVVTVKTDDGFVCNFQDNELVKILLDQWELSKFSDINNKMLKQKISEKSKKKTLFKKTKNEVLMEVDLHINKLVKSMKGLDKYDILSKQLDTAKFKLEYCIDKRIQRIVFIHGVGEGVLKSELHTLLGRYPVKFYDASYKEYGLGATEVYVFQNS